MAFVSSGKKGAGMAREVLPIQIELPEHFLDEEVRCGLFI